MAPARQCGVPLFPGEAGLRMSGLGAQVMWVLEPGQPGSAPHSGQDPLGGHIHVTSKGGCPSSTLHVQASVPVR